MLFRRSRAQRDELPEVAPPAGTRGHTDVKVELTATHEQHLAGTNKVYGPLADEHASSTESSTEGSLFGLRVLLAEDHDVNADLMIEELTHLGAQVRHAADGDIACQLFMANAFDVVLMDCQMPNVDGFEAARRIRAWEAQRGQRAIPIIAMTGLSHEFEHAHSCRVGMNHYLVKPFYSTQLAWTILRATAALRSEKRG